VPADRHLDRGFLAGPAWVRAVAVEPGREQFGWLPVALDERGPDVPPEYRGPVVAAAGVAAGQVPAVLPEPAPQARPCPACHDPGGHWRGRDRASGRCWQGIPGKWGRRPVSWPAPGRSPGQAVLMARGDGQSVSGGVDDEPEGVPGPLRADPAGGDVLPTTSRYHCLPRSDAYG
jgi:hypothetical protein